MGVCASSQIMRRNGGSTWPPTAIVIDSSNGRLKEFKKPIKAEQILSQHPNTFLCNSETMFVGSHAPHVPAGDDLQLGQIYFLMPIPNYTHKPLSLPDLCSLAIKASSALNHSLISHKAFPADACKGPPAFGGGGGRKIKLYYNDDQKR